MNTKTKKNGNNHKVIASKQVKKNELQLNKYGQVDCRRGVPAGYVITSHNKRFLEKHGIKYYEALVDIQYAVSHIYKPVLKKIISLEDNDILSAILSAEAELEREKLKKHLTNKKKIAEAIYSIEKEVKRRLEILNVWSYQFDKNAHLFFPHPAKKGLYDLFDLKDRALRKLIKESNLSPVGYHTFISENKDMYMLLKKLIREASSSATEYYTLTDDMKRDMYVIEGFCFHLNERKSKNSLGDIENFVEADRKRSISLKKAKKLLNLYLEN